MNKYNVRLYSMKEGSSKMVRFGGRLPQDNVSSFLALLDSKTAY